MKAPLARLGLPLLLGLALLGLACSNSYGIFASVQEETKSDTSSKFLSATVVGLVPYGTSYYARLSSIYTRTKAAGVASGWTYLSAAGVTGISNDQYYCTGLASVDGTGAATAGLYAALGSGYVAANPQGIYRYDGSAWTQALASTVDIQDLVAVNNELFAVVRTSESSSGSTYDLRYFDGSALQATGITGTSAMPTGGTYSSSNTTYWFVAGTGLYHGTSTTALSAHYTLSKTLSCLTTDDSVLYAGTADGYVAAVSFAGVEGSYRSATSSTNYGVAGLLCVPAGTKTILLAANSYQGYYEADVTSHAISSFSLGDASGAYVATTTNYDTSVRYLPVFGFTYDSGATRLFTFASSTLSTSYGALWSNKYDGTSWGGWVSE